MSPVYRSAYEPDEQAASRQSSSLAALALTLLLVILSLYLVQHLRAEAAFQDCVLSGRVGCIP
jgi:hypothetical protein